MKNFDADKKFFFMEFYADIKESKWARFYSPVLLIRRLAFVVVIIVLGFVGRDFVLGTLL